MLTSTRTTRSSTSIRTRTKTGTTITCTEWLRSDHTVTPIDMSPCATVMLTCPTSTMVTGTDRS